MNGKMMKTFMASALVVALASCGNNPLIKPMASGRPYELLVVMDDDVRNAAPGAALDSVLATDIPGLPQGENMFHVSHSNPKKFNQILNVFRNIILVEINPKIYTQTKFKYVRDEYAKEQMIMVIHSPSKEDLTKFVRTNRQSIIDFFVNAEMNRQIRIFEKKNSKLVDDLAFSMFGCHLWGPDEIQSSKKGKDFFWTSSNSATALINLCMYAYPYSGPQDFERSRVLAKRDSFMRANIPGETPQMYMATDTATVFTTPITVQGKYALESRGLWQMENDCMGGPFVSHSRVDTVNNRVVVVEGFVYAPEKMKRGLVRRLEAALYTLRLPEGKTGSGMKPQPQADASNKENK